MRATMTPMGGGPAAIRVMSLNVCGLPSRLAPPPDRAPHFCQLVDESDIDVLNLQEVWGRTLSRIRAGLPSFPFVAWRRGLAGQPAGGLVTFSRRPATYHAAFLPPGQTGRRIDYVVVCGDPTRYPVLDTEALFTEPLPMAGGGHMYVSDHVALTARIGLPEPP